LSLRQKEAIEQLLRMSKGREFQIVMAATEKLLEPKYVRTRGTYRQQISVRWTQCTRWNVHTALLITHCQLLTKILLPFHTVLTCTYSICKNRILIYSLVSTKSRKTILQNETAENNFSWVTYMLVSSKKMAAICHLMMLTCNTDQTCIITAINAQLKQLITW